MASAAPCCVGSIPAGAEEPIPAGFGAFGSGVYPRGCGGTSVIVPPPAANTGLSPRVRGNLPPSGWALPLARVYPRGYGGTIFNYDPTLTETGLSPRVRGNHFVAPLGLVPLGSIPAGAGEPYPTCSRKRATRVYPRGCGGTCAINSFLSFVQGLSPRVRGNPSQTWTAGAALGSIPAGAGEPSAESIW